MVLPAIGYIVMLHHQEVGTFAPAFRTMDEAEDFANAMRLVTDGIAISEPVPLIPSLKESLVNRVTT